MQHSALSTGVAHMGEGLDVWGMEDTGPTAMGGTQPEAARGGAAQ
jgi:hypothetical protein